MRAGTVVLGFGVSLLSMGALADMVVEKEKAASSEAAALRLVWVDIHRAADPVHRVVFTETATLLQAAGVEVAWEKSDGRQRAVRDGEVQVVVMPEPRAPLGRHIMGAAQPGANGVRVVWVFLSSVRNALGLSRASQGILRPSDSHRLGRALARVVLHEVVHVADPTRPHGVAGLMAARLDRPFLEGGRLDIETELHPIFRAAAEPRPSAETPALLAVSGGAVIPAMMSPMIAD